MAWSSWIYGAPLAKEIFHIHSYVFFRLISLYELSIILFDDEPFKRHIGINFTDSKFDVSYVLVLDVHDLLPADQAVKLRGWWRFFPSCSYCTKFGEIGYCLWLNGALNFVGFLRYFVLILLLAGSVSWKIRFIFYSKLSLFLFIFFCRKYTRILFGSTISMPILALEICRREADDQLSVTLVIGVLIIFKLGESTLFTEGKYDRVLDDLGKRSHVVAIHWVQSLKILPYFRNVFSIFIFSIIK